jgi:hypothetical protein
VASGTYFTQTTILRLTPLSSPLFTAVLSYS